MDYKLEMNKETKMNQFEIAKSIRDIILQTASEIMNYNWSSDFCFSELKYLEDKIQNYEWFNLINPTRLTEGQMIELGFVKWEKGSDMHLIPLWIYPFLVNNFQSMSVNNEKVYSKTDINLDNRQGFLAYGVYPYKEDEWIDITKQLPEIDEFVLFIYDNGCIFQSHIDKDMDGEYLTQWLKGTKSTGPITHWMRIKSPERS